MQPLSPRFWLALLVCLSLLASTTASAQTTAPGNIPGSIPASAPATAPQPTGRPLDWRRIILPGDHVLFIGDQITQQMFYTRAVATAFLSVAPRANLRFYNGGYDDATAGSAAAWLTDLLDITKANVVFVCFGVNDCQVAGADIFALYRANLTTLIDKIRAAPYVRQVILLGPPALPLDPNAREDVTALNPALRQMADIARAVAATKKTGYIDLFAYTNAVFTQAEKTEGEPLAMGDRPNELGHIIIASVLLKGLGMTTAQLEPVTWCPLLPRKMARVRNALAVQLKIPSIEAAQASRDLYESLFKYDELFFRAWRIAGRRPSAGSRQAVLLAADQAWRTIATQAQQSYGGPGNTPNDREQKN